MVIYSNTRYTGRVVIYSITGCVWLFIAIQDIQASVVIYSITGCVWLFIAIQDIQAVWLFIALHDVCGYL